MAVLVDWLLGSIVAEAVGRAVSGGDRLLGANYGPELRRIVAGAIDEAIETVAPDLSVDDASFLRSVLFTRDVAGVHLETPNASGLREFLGRWTSELDRPEFGDVGYLTGLGIDSGRLADAICDSVLSGVEADARAGGRLGTVAEWLWRDRHDAAVASQTALLGTLVDRFSVMRTDAPPNPASGGLPAEAPHFTGRGAVLDELRRRIASHDPAGTSGMVLGIYGMPGVGKTALAVRVAREHAGRYADHALFIDLHGYTTGIEPLSPLAALEQLIRDAGEPSSATTSDLATLHARWQSMMARRRALIVLDNARDSKQVAPLLPGVPGCLVLVTSRRQLTAIPEVVSLGLGVLSPDEAESLFVRSANLPSAASGPALRDLVASGGGVPLALLILASRLRGAPAGAIDQLLADVADARDRLDVLSPEDLGLRAAFGVSVDRLDPLFRDLYWMVGLHVGPSLSPPSLAALADVTPEQTRRALRHFAEHHLVEPDIDAESQSRYQIHDLLGAYARELAREHLSAEATGAAYFRLVEFYGDCLDVVDRLVGPGESLTGAGPPAGPTRGVPLVDERSARAWLAAERANLLALAAVVPAKEGSLVGLIAARHLRRIGYYGSARELYQYVHDASTTSGDELVRAHAVRGLADDARLTGDPRAAHDGYQRAREVYQALGHAQGLADALRGLGDTARITGQYPAAETYYQQAYDTYATIDHRLGMTNARYGQATIARLAGDHETARAWYSEVRDAYRDLGNPLGLAHSLRGLADTAFASGRYPEAYDLYHEALGQYTAVADPRGTADALTGIAHVHRVAGHHERARQAFQEAHDLYQSIGDGLGQANALWGLGLVAGADNATESADLLRQALAGFERIGSPNVDVVRAAVERLSGS